MTDRATVLYAPTDKTVALHGERSERLADVIARANPAGTPEHDRVVAIVWAAGSADDSPFAWLAQPIPDSTFGEFLDYFGDEAKANPPTIRLERGGGGWTLPALLDLLGVGGRFVGVARFSLAAQRAALRVWHRDAVRAAQHWVDEDELLPVLRDFVTAEYFWERTHFDRALGLEHSRRAGTDLLKALGYSRSDDQFGEEWVRVEQDPYVPRFVEEKRS